MQFLLAKKNSFSIENNYYDYPAQCIFMCAIANCCWCCFYSFHLYHFLFGTQNDNIADENNTFKCEMQSTRVLIEKKSSDNFVKFFFFTSSSSGRVLAISIWKCCNLIIMIAFHGYSSSKKKCFNECHNGWIHIEICVRYIFKHK